MIKGAGFIVQVPTIDIAEVGAGGGSIAAIDAAGGMLVGPRSAGAEPGPVCYDRRRHRADRHRCQPAARVPESAMRWSAAISS